jgi:peroxiredoxin Q/BCP
MKKLSVLLGLVISLCIGISWAGKVDVGSSAPDGSAKNEEGQNIHLADYYKKGMVLVYFYPKADTPGCTAQACSLRDAYTLLQEQGVTVFGVSTDSVKDQKAFRLKYKLPFMLLSDEDKKLAKAFEVPVNFGFSSRQAFLVKDSKIIWLDRTASTTEQAKDVLDVLNKLNTK